MSARQRVLAFAVLAGVDSTAHADKEFKLPDSDTTVTLGGYVNLDAIWRYLTACAALMLGLSGEVGAQPTGASLAPLTELVAQIAFYPDVLVGQVLVASTHPDEILNAEAWLEGDRPWDPSQLAQEVDANTWSPDIKSLALMRPVLDAMSRDLAWTKAVGEAYTRNPAEVVRAVQVVRRAAQDDGELISRSGQRVIVSGATILLEPVDPQFVYVPGRGVFDVGAYQRFSWGWHGWQLGWKDGAVRYQDAPQSALNGSVS